jgi:translocation and assembly module TamB
MLKRIILGLFIVCSAFLLGVSWLILSNSGLQTAINLAKYFVPQLEIKNIRGRLLDGFCAEKVHYQQSDGLQTDIHNLCLAWFWEKNTLFVPYLETDKMVVSLPTQSKPSNDPPTIPDIKLPFQIDLPLIRLKNTQVAQFDISLFELSAFLDSQVHLDFIQVKSPLFQMASKGKIGLQPPHDINLKTDWDTNLLKGFLEVSGNINELKLKNNLQKPLIAQIQVQVQGLPQYIDWKADITTELVCYPFECEHSKIKVKNIDMQGEGDLKNYQLKAKVALSGENIPESQLNLTAKGTDKQLTIQELLINTLKGQLKTEGEISWLPEITWDLKVAGTNFDPSTQWKDWEGSINFALQASGKKTDQLQATVQLNELKGTLRDYPLSAMFELQIKDSYYQVDKFEFMSGEALLKVNGFYKDMLTFGGKWEIKVPQLVELLPEGEGNFYSKGEIQSHKVIADLKGENLRFQDFVLDSVNGKIQAAVDIKAPFAIDLQATNLQQNEEIILDSLKLQSNGKIENHQLTLSASSPLFQINSHLNAGINLEKQQWTAILQKLNVDLQNNLGNWKLKETVNIQASPTEINLNKLCFQRDKASICTKAHWDKTKGAQLDAEMTTQFDILNSFLPEDTNIIGSTKATLNATMFPSGQLQGEANLNLSEGSIELILAEDLRRFQHHGGLISAKIDNSGLHGEAKLHFLENSFLDANWQIAGLNHVPIPNNSPINGQIDIKFNELNIVSGYMPVIENVKGEMDMQLKINGNLPNPRFNGFIRLQNGTVEIPDIGTRLKEISFNLQTVNDSQLQLNASLQAGEGVLQAQGLINWQAMNGDIKISGDRLKLLDTNEFTAFVSPDLNIKLEKEKLDILGKIEIPSASIMPNISLEKSDDPTKVKPKTKITHVSPDVVILSDEEDESEHVSKFQMHLKTLVALGDDIKLNVMGFESKLVGAVEFELSEGSITGNGAFSIEKGLFRAYGQDLEINQGLILFIESPVDDPNLDIRAVRHIRNDKNIPRVNEAGLLITGSAQSPVIELFSEPKVEDSQILSYIITGSALNSDPSKSSLSIGSYLRPDLYMSFGFSLFDESKAFNLRYEINEKWGVETTIGDKDQGLDFAYTLGR